MIFETHLRQSDGLVNSDAPIREADVLQNRLMASYMIRLSKQAVERLCLLSGSRVAFNSHPMQVILRDVLVGATHRSYSWDAIARDYTQSIGIARGSSPFVGP
jgi:hypothetical protein